MRGDIGEKVAYLKGLSDGLDVAKDTGIGRLVMGMLEVLEVVAREVYGPDDDLFDEPVYFKVECSGCGENVFFEDTLIEDDFAVEVACPNCEQTVYRWGEPASDRRVGAAGREATHRHYPSVTETTATSASPP
jgi:hypothetical protein